MHILLPGMIIIRNVCVEKHVYEKVIKSLAYALSAGMAVIFR